MKTVQFVCLMITLNLLFLSCDETITSHSLKLYKRLDDKINCLDSITNTSVLVCPCEFSIDPHAWCFNTGNKIGDYYLAVKINHSFRTELQQYRDSVIYFPMTGIQQEQLDPTNSFKINSTLGRFSCNTFVVSKKDNTVALTETNNGLQLDSFVIGNKIFIHLLTAIHNSHHDQTNQIFDTLENQEFNIKAIDFKNLEDTIKTNRLIMGGSEDRNNLRLLIAKIVANDKTDLFKITQMTKN